VRLRPEYRKHVWSYAFVEDKTYNGTKLRFLNIIDEYSKECLASIPRHSWRNNDLIEVLSGLMVTKGCPSFAKIESIMHEYNGICKLFLRKNAQASDLFQKRHHNIMPCSRRVPGDGKELL
jgi:hypothetical protein